MLRTSFAVALGAFLAACGPVETSGSPATGQADGGPPASGGTAGSPGAPGNSGSTASLSIVAPENGGECEVGEKHAGCRVKVALAGAVLAAPGACGGSSGSCGHIDFYIDGTNCGAPNTQAWTTSFDAQVAKCPSISGQHTFSCVLRDDRGARIASSQNVTVTVKRED